MWDDFNLKQCHFQIEYLEGIGIRAMFVGNCVWLVVGGVQVDGNSHNATAEHFPGCLSRIISIVGGFNPFA